MPQPKSQVDRLVHAVVYGKGASRALAITAAALLSWGLLGVVFSTIYHGPAWLRFASQFCFFVGASVGTVFTTVQRAEEAARTKRRIESAEKKVAENPKEPQAAWELAQVKLESYLNRNLSQVRSIYLLTVAVMLVGFSFIIAGSFEAFRDPDRFKASVLSSLSGVVVSFIGGTFLVLHKSTMSQAKDYVTILERINAVGMSMQILDSLEDENADLKQETTALIARQLLLMYSPRGNELKITPRKAPSHSAGTS